MPAGIRRRLRQSDRQESRARRYRRVVPTTPCSAAVVLAGGNGTRLGAGHNKVYLPLAGRLVVSWALESCRSVSGVGPVVLVIREQDREAAEWVVRREARGQVDLVVGGESRHESEFRALAHLAPTIRSGRVDVVLIHDGARPLVPPSLVGALLDAARRHGAAVPGIPLEDAWQHSPDTEHRALDATNGMRRMQTPQAFRAAPLLEAYERADLDGFTGTDTAACVERYADLRVRCLPGDPRNLKLTYPEDLFIAEQILARSRFRIV